MKKEIKIAILLVAPLAVILLASCDKSGERTAADGPAKPEQGRLTETKPGAVESLYHCPMHPTYVSDRPGDCPICGMKLVEVEAKDGVARLMLEHFQMVQQKQADRLVILKLT